MPLYAFRQGVSLATDSSLAASEIADQIQQHKAALTLVFFASDYDLQSLGQHLHKHLPTPLIGCTSAGQITAQGFQRQGISGASFSRDCLWAKPYLIHPLQTIDRQIHELAQDVHEQLDSHPDLQAFGLLLIDGLSGKEEILTASLYQSLGDIPIIGGSAGDMLAFQKTHIFYNGAMYSDAAVFTLCLTSRPFLPFKHQHFHPSETRLVITEADPESRMVYEINGEPAVETYARLIGVPSDQLNAGVFSRHPLMLRIMDDYFIRSVAGITAEGGMKFYCAIDKGLVLHIGEAAAPRKSMEATFKRIQKSLGPNTIILGCDCILRRLEHEQRGIAPDIGALMSQYQVFGFSTYGEQFNSTHINQTFTGIAIAL